MATHDRIVRTLGTERVRLIRLTNPAQIRLSATAIAILIVLTPGLFSLSGTAVAQDDASEPVTGELSTDDPPVNFRITGTGSDWIGLAWEVPRDRGITNYVLQPYEHDGNEFVATRGLDGNTNGGAGYSLSNGKLESDTRYKYVLLLKNESGMTIIEGSVEGRTLSTSGPTASTDATLSGLALSGVSIGLFSSGDTYYTASVANNVTETTVSATVNDAGASHVIKLGGVVDADGVIPLAVGSNTITVAVTAEDGFTTRIYTVVVTRAGLYSTDATLSGLSLSGVDIGSFNSSTTGYTARVPKGTTQTTVTPTVNHSGASYVIKAGGVVDADGVISLSVGSNVITVEVTAEDGSTTRTYTVTVTRFLSTDATLSGLTLSGVDFGTFGSTTTSYSAQVSNDVTQTTVSPTVSHSGASYVIKLGGVADADGEIPLAVGTNTITVEVTAEDGSTSRTYTVGVTRSVVTGGLSTDEPPVNFRITGYGSDWIGLAWEVPRDRGITNYVLQPYEHDGNEFVSSGAGGRFEGETNGGAGYALSNGKLESDRQYKYVLLLKNDAGTTVIEKSVEGRTQSTSGPTASTDATLSGLSLSGVDIGLFSSGDTYYTASAGNDVTETTVGATVNDAGASQEIKLGGVVDDDGVIPLAVGGNTITIAVTAADGITSRIYTVIVTRAGLYSIDATLSGLSLSGVDFGAFDSATTSYTAQVASDVTETKVTPAANDAGASSVVKLDGVVDEDGVIPLALGRNVITVEVTAEDGSTTRTYTVTVTRFLSTDATLTGLTLTGVDIGTFDPATTSYSAQVANDVTETTVSATVNGAGASYVINLDGVEDADGVIPLSVGRNIITVEVTAEDGSSSRTYTVTVARTVVTGELSTDDPPVNFRITGYGEDWIGLAWAVPQDRSITNYVLQSYEHDGNEFAATRGFDGNTNGGAGYALSNGKLEPDTQYKYVLLLKNDSGTTIIEGSVEGRTLSTTGTTDPTDPPASTDAMLRELSLSGIDIGSFSSRDTDYTASVGNDVTETTVSPTVNDAGASYVIKLGGVVDADGVIPLAEGSNVITIAVTAEDVITTRIYTVRVTRGDNQEPPSQPALANDATLSDLTLGGIDFGAFGSATTSYTASVANEVTQTSVSLTANHSGASYVIKSGGEVDEDGVITLAEGSNVIAIEVTAEDGSTTRTYTVTVTRAASETSSTGKTIPRTLTKHSGNNQEGPAGTALPGPFVVEVRDQNDNPLEGAQVTFAVAAGGGSLSTTTATTDADGHAASTLTLGDHPGRNTVAVRVAELKPVIFSATGQTLAQTLTKISGDEQQGSAGASLAEPFVVEVADQAGAAVTGATVAFAVTAGEGTLSTTTATTDADGHAASTLTLGSQPGSNTVEVTVAGLAPVTFTATAEAMPDFDGDGETGFTDFFLFADAFGGSDPRFDLDGSGIVDFADFFLFADQFGGSDRGKLLALARELIGLPDGPQLEQNAPNPFNSETAISWYLLRPGPARLEVFALTGQQVAVLRQGPHPAGNHRLLWDGRDNQGRPLASGTYLYRLVTGEGSMARKFMLLR